METHPGKWPTWAHCVSPPAEGKHQYLVVLFRWASREDRSRAAMGLGYSRLFREVVEQHPYCQVEGSAGLSPHDPTAIVKRTNEQELGKVTRTAADKFQENTRMSQ